MAGGLAATWLLTVVFAASGLGSLPVRRPPGPARAADRVSAIFHVVTSVALIAMAWRSEPTLAVWLQTALFGSAVIWFALGRSGGTARRRVRWLPGFHHALMSAAMIWMITALPTAMPMAPAAPARSGMPAMSHPAGSAAVLVISVLLAAYFALAAIPWFARAKGPGRRPNDRAAASHAAMSAGMAGMLLTLL